jgi:Fe-S cluster assembly protein SufD
MTQLAERHETLSAAFDTFRRDPAFGPEWLGRVRQAAFERFLERGFPTTREEEWRFTSIAPVAATTFVRPAPAAPSRSALAPYVFDAVPTIVLVNGRVSRALSSAVLPKDVTLRTIDDADAATPAARTRSYTTGEPTPFVHLNGAFFEDLVTLRVAPKSVIDQPIHVLSLVVTDREPMLVAPRLAIDVGEGAEFVVIESYASIGSGRSLTTAVTDLTLGPGAILKHVKIQRESDAAFHLASTFVTLGRSATFTSQALTFGGRIARNDIFAVLDGEGAECTLNGLYLADGDAVVDTHTTIDHARPHCPSHEVYKGILAGRSRAVFNGKIIVRPDAQKTDAKQTNKALLLSDEATINTKPQLEIFADDVKCTHGAAIGQLDEDAMFYLRARGIAEVDARSLLIHAFAGQVLDGIPVDAVRDGVLQVMEDKLKIAHEERTAFGGER